jgi:hypothetical protein
MAPRARSPLCCASEPSRLSSDGSGGIACSAASIVVIARGIWPELTNACPNPRQAGVTAGACRSTSWYSRTARALSPRLAVRFRQFEANSRRLRAGTGESRVRGVEVPPQCSRRRVPAQRPPRVHPDRAPAAADNRAPPRLGTNPRAIPPWAEADLPAYARRCICYEGHSSSCSSVCSASPFGVMEVISDNPIRPGIASNGPSAPYDSVINKQQQDCANQ